MVNNSTFARCWKYTSRYPSHVLENIYFRLSLRIRQAELNVFQNMAKMSCGKSGRQPKQSSVLFPHIWLFAYSLSRASYKTPSKLIARDARYSLREMSLDSYKGACTARKSPHLQAEDHNVQMVLCLQMDGLFLAVRTQVD